MFVRKALDNDVHARAAIAIITVIICQNNPNRGAFLCCHCLLKNIVSSLISFGFYTRFMHVKYIHAISRLVESRIQTISFFKMVESKEVTTLDELGGNQQPTFKSVQHRIIVLTNLEIGDWMLEIGCWMLGVGCLM